MGRERIIQTLREHERELRAAGIRHLRLFGSVARGDAGPDSDVDLAAQFDRAISLLTFAGIQNRLSDILGVSADLSDMDRLKDYVRVRSEREAELVF